MPSKHKLIIIILLSTIFGLFSGVVGAIIARVYILEDAFSVPLFGELSFDKQQEGSNIVIHNAKKVIIEQNVKIDEVVRSSKESIVWIYKKIDEEKDKNQEEPKNKLDLEKYYRIDNYLAHGFVLTSDGWIVTDFLPENVALLTKNINSTSSRMIFQEALKGFVAIDRNENQYSVSSLVNDEVSGLTYWKIEATGLPVKEFGLYGEITNGQIALAINSKGQVWLTSISGIVNDKNIFEYSDVFDPRLILNEPVVENFFSSFLFDINGNILGLIDKTGVVKPMSSFMSCINCLLEQSVISHPALGVHYVDLAKYFYDKNILVKKGAFIKGNLKERSIDILSPAEIAGLKDGDIITSVNGKELNRDNNLAYIVSTYKVGDKISIEYIREGEVNQVEIILGKR